MAIVAITALTGCTVTTNRGLGPLPDAGGADPTDAFIPGEGDAPEPMPMGCDGPDCKHQPLGSACAVSADCESGVCADGVCCNTSCSSPCVSCNLPGKPGQCVMVEAGTPDPHGICRDQGANSCGQTGLCSAQGACAKYAAGSVCKPSQCSGGSMVPAGSCDGRGTCLDGPAIACDPYMCGGNACRVRCESDQDCVAPATCVNGSCGKRGLGQACSAATDCKSGFCADGVCCSEACTERCRFCGLASSLGRCVNVPADAPDPRVARGVTDPTLICAAQAASSCGTNGLCNGTGGCQRFAAGTQCRAETCDAAKNTYTGQFSCDGDGQCVPPAGQSCAPFQCSGGRCAVSCASNADCVAPAVCQNGSCGKKSSGQLCAAAGECMSGFCQQGVCCTSACTGTCLSCAQPGSLGVCVAVPAGAADPSKTCRDQGAASCGNDGTCSGSGSCRKYAANTVCAVASCTSGKAKGTSTCDGLGVCVAGSSRACAPYACNAAAADCYNSCSDATQCSTGNLCQMGQCGKKALGATCGQTSECMSGFCVDGVCCDNACSGTCQSCAVAGAIGTCSPVPAGQTDPDGSCTKACSPDGTFSQTRACDGAGVCVAAGSPSPCGAYVCKAGNCLTSCGGAADCSQGNVCTSMSCAPPTKKPNGGSCLAASDCMSNNCVDKTCCSSVSCGTCQTCANPAGTCLPVVAGTACGPTACAPDNQSIITPRCDATGTCKPSAPTNCGNYVCSAGACKTSCSGDADCVPTTKCRGHQCR